jgi:hypothetical protein
MQDERVCTESVSGQGSVAYTVKTIKNLEVP